MTAEATQTAWGRRGDRPVASEAARLVLGSGERVGALAAA